MVVSVNLHSAVLVIISFVYVSILIAHLVNSWFICTNFVDKEIINKIIFGLSASGLILFLNYFFLFKSWNFNYGTLGYRSKNSKANINWIILGALLLILFNFISTLISSPEIVVVDKNVIGGKSERYLCTYRNISALSAVFIIWFLCYDLGLIRAKHFFRRSNI
jgi:hypothetical protein